MNRLWLVAVVVVCPVVARAQIPPPRAPAAYQPVVPAASAGQYYDQAGQIADSGQATQNEEWLPLGVFAVIAEPTQTQTDKVVQLALNKEGVVRGNLQDSLADKVMPVVGAVDKKTQRVALKLEGSDSVVVETGIYNLTNDCCPIMRPY